MAADRGEITALARKLRGKGLDDDKVRESLRGLGFTRADADTAVASLGPTSQQPPKAPAKQPPPTAAPLPVGPSSGGQGTPSFEAPDLSKLTLSPPRRPNPGDLGGFMAGLVLYALAINYLRFGPDGVKGWLGAKFLNRPAALGTGTGNGGQGQGRRGGGLTSTRPTTTTI